MLNIIKSVRKSILSFSFHGGFSVLMSIILFIAISPKVLHAEPFIRITANSQLAYADQCFRKQDYKGAAAEYKRFIYFFPDDPRADIAAYQTGMSYFLDRSYIQAIKQFADILDQKGPSGKGIPSALMISRCYQKLHNHSAAIENLLYLGRISADAELDDTISNHLGWLYLESGDFESARAAFSKIRPDVRDNARADDILAELDRVPQIPQKSPVIAGMLSVIPGGGYFYCGRYRDAITACLINGALIYAAYESFEEDLYGIGGIISAIEAGFYAGSIYGGISSAHKYNQARKNAFAKNLEEKYQPDLIPGISLVPTREGVCFGLSYRF